MLLLSIQKKTMNMKKQLKLIMPAIFMVLASLTGYGQQQFEINGYEYKEITPTSTPPQVEIVGYTGAAKEVTILQTVNHNGIDYDVTSIGYRAFHNKQLTKITFMDTPSTPSNVTHIREDAFWGLRGFETKFDSVVIPNSVTHIGQRAFGTIRSLVHVTIPSSVTRIEKWAFAQCDLRELTIPATVEHIGEQAFYRKPMASQGDGRA